MKIWFGYDRKSKPEGEVLTKELTFRGYELMYCHTLTSERYPEVAFSITYHMGRYKEPDKAVLLCRTGVGMCIVANKYPGIRAVVGSFPRIVRRARERNNCNVLCLGASSFSVEWHANLVDIFMTTKYQGESDENLKLIQDIERRIKNGL